MSDGPPDGLPDVFPDVFTAAARLRRESSPFVLATVVRAERPTSARPGAKAIITPDGELEGFVGGACVKPAVRREALRALADGVPRLLRISPNGHTSNDGADEAGEEGVVEEAMACVSGGALDIHLEPFLPARRLLLAGNSPILDALGALGHALGMETGRVGADDLDEVAEGAFVVVAGHGEGEWEALRAGLTGGARYVGLVASPRRAAAVRERLGGMGVAPEDVQRLRSPAGLDIGAESAGEIALSILAEIVGEARAREQAEGAGESDAVASAATPPVGITSEPAPAVEFVVDPVCGMSVSPDSPHRLEAGGEVFRFCCAGCVETFAASQSSGEAPEARQ